MLIMFLKNGIGIIDLIWKYFIACISRVGLSTSSINLLKLSPY